MSEKLHCNKAMFNLYSVTENHTETVIPSFAHSFFCISSLFILVFSGLFLLKTSIHSIILLCIFWVILNAWYLNPNVEQLRESIRTGVQKSSFLLLFFILIGAVIAAFTLSGAIPTLVYYGLNLISPKAFLPIGMILCSLMSLAIGSCWGTIGTMGVALMGVATILHIPLPITAGMIISGAYFGDKLSPISDTTILSASTTDTDLYKHIKGMTYSLIPAYLICAGIFWFIGMQQPVGDSAQLQELSAVQHVISQNFNIGPIALLPMLVMFLLSIYKKPAELSMLCSVVIAIIVAMSIQHWSLAEVLNGLFTGPMIHTTDSTILNTVLSRGGIQSMLWTMALTLLILVLGSILESYRFISVLFESLIGYLKKPTSLVFSTLLTTIMCNMLMGEAYLSIILTSRIFKKAYHHQGLDSCVLSKAVEEGGTLSTPLIPWTTSGAFIIATLGISPFDYLLWSFFNMLAPLCFLIFVKINFAGIKMYRSSKSCKESAH